MLSFLFTKTPLIFLIQSLWRDEAYSYLLSSRSIFEIISLSLRDFSPPLYYFILHYWIALFGKSEIALRSLSLIFFWAALYVVYLILNEVFKFDLKKSLLYLLFFVVNPVLIYYAFEVRMYSMFAFLSALSFYALLKRDKRLYLIATILGLYTHYFMVFIVIGQYLVVKFKQKQALMAFVPWMVFVLANRIAANNSFWIEPVTFTRLFTFPAEILTGYENNFGFFTKQLKYLSLATIATVVYAYLKSRKLNRKDNELFRLLMVWGIWIPFFVLIVSFIKPLFLPRYLIFSSVGLSFILVYAFEKMPVYIKAFVIAFFVAFLFNFQKLQIAKRTKAPLRQTLSEITKLMKPGDSIYVLSELDYFTAQYYADKDKIYIYGKNYEEIPDYIGKVLVTRDRVTTTLPVYPKKAFVINADGSYDIQALY